MKEIEKILVLLENDNVTKDELLSAAGNNEEAIEFISAYEKLLQIYNSKHISTDEIKDYILNKNNMKPETETILERVPAIKKHLSNCVKCNDEYKLLAGELTEIDGLLKAELHKKPAPVVHPYVVKKQQFNFYRYAALIIIVPMLIFTSAYLFQPSTYKFTSIENKEDLYTTRGRNADEFMKASESIDNKKYLEAIQFLNSDIKNNSNDETVFYSYYLTGLLNLEISESSFLGIFKKYNKENVALAIDALKKCIEKNNSGKYNNVNLDAEFYLGKAYLMLENTTEAKMHFQKVVDKKGSKIKEAGDILENIN